MNPETEDYYDELGRYYEALDDFTQNMRADGVPEVVCICLDVALENIWTALRLYEDELNEEVSR